MKDFTISPYAITFASALVIGFTMACVMMKKRGIPRNIIGYSVFLNVVMILCGAKMYTVVTGGFRVGILGAGTASLGGVIGLLASIMVMGVIYKEGKKDMLEAYVLVVPLMYGVAKIGCYLAGCCHGIPYTGPGAVSYDNAHVQGGPYFPVQLSESIVFLLIFAGCMILYQKNKTEAFVPVVILLCAAGKFMLDFLREEHLGKILSVNQVVCLLFFAWGCYEIVKNTHNKTGR